MKAASDKTEDRLLTKVTRCKTRKCSKLYKQYTNGGNAYRKEEEKHCPQKSKMAFYDCSVGFYNKSTHKKAFDKYVKCSTMKCSKEYKALEKYRQNQFLRTVMNKR